MIKKRILPFKQAVPAILLFQILSKAVLALWMILFGLLARLLLFGVGKVAVSSGDLGFLFTSWQGYLLIALSIITLFVYLAIDINALIILCGRLLRGEKPSVLKCIKDGLLSLKKLLNWQGVLIVLYIALLSPILGMGITISLTSSFYIPSFITSVIFGNPFYLIGCAVVALALLIIGNLYVFILHGVLLDNLSMKESAKRSLALIKKNVKNYLKEMVIFFVVQLLLVAATYLFAITLPMLVMSLQGLSDLTMAVLATFLFSVSLAILIPLNTFFAPFLILKLTALYFTYRSDGEWTYQERKKRVSPLVIVFVIFIAVLIAALTVMSALFSDDLFRADVKAGIIAHRAGGFEAAENTAAGIDAAYKYGAYGSEIDIQRTADGYYVVNHDDTFNRTAGVDKKPDEMTLEEVKKLRVNGEPVPTLEEMLDSSRDRVTLLVELKGSTADNKMADDAVRIIKEKGMVDQTIVISLKYNLIEYIEETYPEINTGYLAFASFGDTSSLNCDYLALEEETATDENIDSIHENGKKIFVWTVDDEDSLKQFMLSDADGIITDDVSGAAKLKRELDERPPYRRIIDGLTYMFLQ